MGVSKSYTSKDNDSDQWKLISGDTYAFAITLLLTGNKLISGNANRWYNPITLYSQNVNCSEKNPNKVTWGKFSPPVLSDGNTIILN